ncbi:MAG: succinylglutamate desuccinylase, partial [Rhodospirillales bacterium]|nr:succinylglutamate desuccinylase [Rhodospirillales bacterium]
MSAGPLPKQRFIEVTGPVTIETDDFRFAADYRGLEVIPKAGTVIGHDGDRPVATPYDDCVLVMPSRRLLKG